MIPGGCSFLSLATLARRASSAYLVTHFCVSRYTLSAYFLTHLCALGLPSLSSAALAGGEDRSPVTHRRLCPMDVQLPPLARGHAVVVSVTDANLDALRGVDGCLVRHVVSVSLVHL